jgi:Flp pilus assembly protein TadG
MTFLRDRRGVAIPEFAVAIGVVLTLIFAILDLGLLLAARHALDYGVEKAVRYAVVNSAGATPTSIAGVFTGAVTPMLGASGAANCKVTVSYASGNAPGGTVAVTVSFPWQPVTSLDFLPAITLTASQTLTIQH